tara:strand:+ start:67 stop:258 length:192 start_codon:yes stop_codon:yes gene_type:complete
MMKVISFLNKCGPLFFGVLILAPVLVEIMNLYNFSFPIISNIVFSLLLGFSWGLIATIRGSWI